MDSLLGRVVVTGLIRVWSMCICFTMFCHSLWCCELPHTHTHSHTAAMAELDTALCQEEGDVYWEWYCNQSLVVRRAFTNMIPSLLLIAFEGLVMPMMLYYLVLVCVFACGLDARMLVPVVVVVIVIADLSFHVAIDVSVHSRDGPKCPLPNLSSKCWTFTFTGRFSTSSWAACLAALWLRRSTSCSTTQVGHLFQPIRCALMCPLATTCSAACLACAKNVHELTTDVHELY